VLDLDDPADCPVRHHGVAFGEFVAELAARRG
jgi:hypothetical protein